MMTCELGSDSTRCLSVLAAIIDGFRYSHVDEYPLQDGVAEVLRGANIAIERERACSAGRIDIYIPSTRIGIEVKVDGSSPSVTRQLFDYATDPDIDGLLLITTRSKHLSVPRDIRGVPVHIVHLWKGGL